MRVVFLGTPMFAVPSLAALARRHEVGLVVTQPDRPRGRGRRVTPPPIKELALRLGLPLRQFSGLLEDEAQPHFADAGAEIAVVVAFGLKLPDWLLAFPPRGVINVHGSLLPAYRGAAPVNRAILNGDHETGVTTMLVSSRMDAGPVLLQRSTPIGLEETAGELAGRLAEIGAQLLIETLDGLAEDRVRPQEQDESRATVAPKLKKEDGLVDWGRAAPEIVNLVRGVNPWPGAWTHYQGRLIKVWKASITGGEAPAPPGTILAASPKEGLVVATGRGAVSLALVQTEGRKALQAAEFLAGFSLAPGTRFD